MKPRTLVIVLLVVAGLLVGLWFLQRRSAVPPMTFAGTIEQRDAQVGSLVGGRVIAVHTDEGKLVKRGEVLVTLEPDLLQRQIKEQEAAVRVAEAELLLVRNGPRAEELERARVTWENAERERVRLEPMVAVRATSQQEYDNAATFAATSQQTWEELKRGSRPEDIERATAAAEQAAARLAFLKRQLQELDVVAPADGVIQTLDLRPGDLVAPNQPVASLLEENQLWIRVYVPEPQLALVHVGQQAAISVDGLPDRTFPGKVASIRERAEYTPRNVQTIDQRADQVFGVRVTVDPTPELKAGMAALVRLSGS